MEFLHPWALSLLTSLAIPVWLHFRQRSQPRQTRFPSLLLLRRGFPQAMQKQKLRDLLQLILRLLLLLCLVLALAQPNRKQDGMPSPKQGVFIIDNGLWGQIRQPGGSSLLSLQLRQSQVLEKAWTEGLRIIPLLQQGGLSASEDRYGDMRDAMKRALAAARENGQGQGLVMPVFSWTALQGMTAALPAWLEESPGNRLMLWDLTAYAQALPRFESASAKKDSSGGWHLQLRQSETLDGREKAMQAKPGIMLLSAGMEKRLPPQGLTLQTRLPPGEWQGRIMLDVPEPDLGAWNTWHFAVGKTGPRRLVHYGSAFATLPSLKQDLNRSEIMALSENQPWPTLTSKGENALAGIFLAGQMPASTILEKISGYVLEGGALVISAGSGTDLVPLNSRVLGPLGLGRLTNWTRHPSPLRITANTQNFSGMGVNIETWGKPGEVREQFASSLMPETSVLLQAGDMPLLLYKRAGRGALLVWTTEIDSLAWTDIGLTPFLPLVHQAFLKTLEFGDTAILAASDSVITLAMQEGDIQVLDPQGKNFTRVQKTWSGWRLGPFPKAGLYRIASEADTQALVVNPRQAWLPQARENEQAVQQSLVKAWASVQNQVSISRSPPETLFAASERVTGLPWLAAAVMLLLLDGLVALVLNPKSQTPSAPWVSKAPHV